MKWLADECLDNDIILRPVAPLARLRFGTRSGCPEVAGSDDETLLAWADKNGRVILTHDLATMVPALQRQDRLAFTAIVLVPDSLPIGRIIEDILLLDQCSRASDWTAGVIYLPLR